MRSSPRGHREGRDLHALRDEQLDPGRGIGRVGTEVHAEGLVGALLRLVDRGHELVVVEGPRGDDPQRAGVRRRRREARPRHPAHAGLHDRPVDAAEVTERGVERRSVSSSASRSDPGSRTSRSSRRSSSVGTRDSGDVGGDHERESRRRGDVVDRDAGVHGPEAHGVFLRLEVEDAEVGDDAPDLVVLRSPPGPRRRRGRSRCRRRSRRPRRTPAVSAAAPSSSSGCSRCCPAHPARRGAAPWASPTARCTRCSGCRDDRSASRPSSRGAGPTTRCRTSCRTAATLRRPSRRRPGRRRSGSGPPSCTASPSVYTRSGSNVSAARRAPSVGITPIGLARISPSPRQASAHATTQTSTRDTAVTRPPLPASARQRRGTRLQGHRHTSERNADHASASFAVAAYSRWKRSSRS